VKVIVAFIVVVSFLGTIFTGGQAQYAFEQLLIMGVVFVLVVELVPQFIVAKDSESQTSRDGKM